MIIVQKEIDQTKIKTLRDKGIIKTHTIHQYTSSTMMLRIHERTQLQMRNKPEN